MSVEKLTRDVVVHSIMDSSVVVCYGVSLWLPLSFTSFTSPSLSFPLFLFSLTSLSSSLFSSSSFPLFTLFLLSYSPSCWHSR